MTTPRIDADIHPGLSYDDAAAAIEFLCRAFGFTQRLVVPGPDGTIRHSELTLGNGVVMVGSPKPEQGRIGARTLGRVSTAISVCIADPDAHHARAQAAGAKILRAPQDEDYGGRGYMAADPEGNQWYFGTYRPGTWWT